jgi:hypothetical protein
LKTTVSVGCVAPTTLTGMPPVLFIHMLPQPAPSVAPRPAPSTSSHAPDFACTGRSLMSAWKIVSAGIRVQPQNVVSPLAAIVLLGLTVMVTASLVVPPRPSVRVTENVSTLSTVGPVNTAALARAAAVGV